MKIYVFVPTGEVRLPKEGECYQLDDGAFNYWQRYLPKSHPVPLFLRHEIDAPDQAPFMDIKFPNSYVWSRRIDLPRKSKVKKWQWLRINKDNYGRPRASISSWLTDEQASEELHGGSIKIPETEIEVEE